ncbi:MAG: rhodanese-related sulfurtransferase [Gammaproteobacteria bacterium]|jgi:rhodanese-related sulfurtransferase
MDFAQISEFAVSHIILVAVTVVIASLLIGNELTLQARGASSISSLSLVQLLNKDGAQVLDIRESGKFKAGHIIGAVNASLDALTKNPSLAKLKNGKPVVVADELGTTAGRAATLLKGQGFDQVFQLKGGMTSWQGDGLPVEK